jgi:poly-beta-1,6-N-acetyl-D-glucosamine synthase
MKLLFWCSASLILFAYAGYPIWLCCRAHFWPRPAKRGHVLPSVTVVLAVHNEERYLPNKLRNLAGLNYPADCLEIVIVSDGSTDDTNRILSASTSAGQRALFLRKRVGKSLAINCAVAEARGEIVVFTDARQLLDADAVRNLVANFADSSVGCVSGELIVGQDPYTPASQGVSLYWQAEKKLRYWESLAGSTVGATGALYAVRRALVPHLPAGTILDDVYIPLEVVRRGYRTVFESGALAWDSLVPTPQQEFRRKLRTLAGNYQLLQLAPWILTSSCPLRWEFVCHKLLRLLVPFALIVVLVSASAVGTGIYEIAFLCQLIFYALASLKLAGSKAGIVARLADISLAFLVLNTAAAVAFFYFVTGRKVIWAQI